jgi:hypothetical protein
MPCVVTPLEPYYDTGAPGQKVDYFTFPLVPPLNTQNDDIYTHAMSSGHPKRHNLN